MTSLCGTGFGGQINAFPYYKIREIQSIVMVVWLRGSIRVRTFAKIPVAVVAALMRDQMFCHNSATANRAR
jgi:hypothetical protein